MPDPGDVHFDPKTGKDRTFIRRAEGGVFAGAQIWAVQDCVSMPSEHPPGTPGWDQVEYMAVCRMGTHEAMESFGFDPHVIGDMPSTVVPS